MASTEALREISRFALSPNKLNLCGLNSSQGRLWKCAATGETQGIEKELTVGFPHLNSFLETIAHITGEEAYSDPVVEAYWLGNDLVSGATLVDYDFLLEQYQKQGAQAGFLEELHTRTPKVFIPTHNFQVVHIGVLEASGVLSHDLPLVNQCMVRGGEITTIDQKAQTVSVNLMALEEKNGQFQLGKVNQKAKFDPVLVPYLQVGQAIAVHWGWVTKPLIEAEVQHLQYWTQEVIDNL